jgi:hypothetical protein
MSDPAATIQLLGKVGEPCAECGAPLAADQRYCLNCGRRRGEPRVDFRAYEAPPRAEGAPAPAAGESKPSRDYTPLAAVGGIAVLGAMLLIGVLIGKGDGGGTATAPPPVVVQGGEAGAGKTAAEDGGGAAKPNRSKASSKGKGKGGGKGGAVSGGSSNTGSAPVASDAQLKQLEEQSPQEYSENSAKLPDEVATGGAPPPEDNKAPGGGSAGTAIE